MMAKDMAKVVFWTSLVSALVIVDADIGCNCTLYGIIEKEFCVDELMDFTWDDTSLVDVADAGDSSLAPSIKFLGKWATCSFMESMSKTIPIIQTCPSNFTGSIEMKNKCEVQSNSIPPVDFDGVLPITFRNIFCVRCHGINEDLMVHVNSWIGNLKCSRKTSSLNDNDICRVQYDPPPTRLHYCNIEYIKFKTVQLERSACNANDTEACVALDFFRYTMIEFAGECSGFTDVGTDLTTLFRFPNKVRSLIINGQVTKESLACKEDESFDEYFFTCRQFVCPPSYFPKLGQCWNNLTIYLDADTQPFPIPKDLLALNISRHLEQFSDTDFILDILKKIKQLFPRMNNITHYSNTWKVKGVLIIYNLTETFLEEFLKTLSYGTVNIEGDVIIEFRLNNNVLKNNISCPKESYELRCTDKAEVNFEKDTMFARLMSNNHSVFVPIENTYFEIKTNINSKIEISSVCYCEPLSVKFDVTCSTKLYKFTANEYTLDIMDGTLEMLSNGIKIANSSFDIDSNGTAFVCLETVSKSLKPFFNYDATISYFSWTCSLISVAFQLATLTLFALFSELRNLSSKITAGLSVTMILGQIGLHMPRISTEFCQSIAFLTHFNWLSAFAWMTSQAVNMFVTFHPRTQSKATGWHDGKAFRKYALVCLILPLVTVGVFFTLDMIPGEHMHSGYGLATCGWFANQSTYIYGFFVPVGLSVLLNIIFFSLTLYHIEKTLSATTKVTGKARNRNMCIIYIKLTSIMGLSWVLGFIASAANSRGLWFVYIILNGLQGVFIFISFSVSARVRQLIKSKLKSSNSQSRETKDSTIGT